MFKHFIYSRDLLLETLSEIFGYSDVQNYFICSRSEIHKPFSNLLLFWMWKKRKKKKREFYVLNRAIYMVNYILIFWYIFMDNYRGGYRIFQEGGQNSTRPKKIWVLANLLSAPPPLAEAPLWKNSEGARVRFFLWNRLLRWILCCYIGCQTEDFWCSDRGERISHHRTAAYMNIHYWTQWL